MSLEHLFREEADTLAFLLGEEFEMSDNFFIQHPEVTRYVLEQEAQRHQIELQEAWNDLQAVPSYVETQAAAWAATLDVPISVLMETATVHTWLRPFCMDLSCPCHNDLDALKEWGAYVDAGLLTVWEWLRTLSGQQI